MCNVHPDESISEATSYGFSASRTYGSAGAASENKSRSRCFYCSSTTDAVNSAEDIEDDHAQIEADLLAFQQMLYRAARAMTVDRFMQLRQRYDLAWYEVLENL